MSILASAQAVLLKLRVLKRGSSGSAQAVKAATQLVPTRSPSVAYAHKKLACAHPLFSLLKCRMLQAVQCARTCSQASESLQ